MNTTTYEIDLQFQKVTTAPAILNDLCMNAALAIETENLVDAYCNIFIPVSQRLTIFAEVQIVNGHTYYYVTSSRNQAAEIQSMSYRQAASKLEALLAA